MPSRERPPSGLLQRLLDLGPTVRGDLYKGYIGTEEAEEKLYLDARELREIASEALSMAEYLESNKETS